MVKSKSKIHCYNNKIVKLKSDAALGVPFGPNDKLSFGKYRGVRLADVPKWYLLRLWDSKRAPTRVLGYIHENLKTITKT